MMVCYFKCRCYYRVEAPIASYLGRVVKGELGPTVRKVSHHHTHGKQHQMIVCYLHLYAGCCLCDSFEIPWSDLPRVMSGQSVRACLLLSCPTCPSLSHPLLISCREMHGTI